MFVSSIAYVLYLFTVFYFKSCFTNFDILQQKTNVFERFYGKELSKNVVYCK